MCFPTWEILCCLVDVKQLINWHILHPIMWLRVAELFLCVQIKAGTFNSLCTAETCLVCASLAVYCCCRIGVFNATYIEVSYTVCYFKGFFVSLFKADRKLFVHNLSCPFFKC